MKFGRIKRQHGRVGGLDKILDLIVKQCPAVTRIVPGRIKVRRGKTPPNFKIQYPTPAGLKCLYTGTGTVQEVFLICSDQEGAKMWLIEHGIADTDKPTDGAQ
jgi:tRNA threonylcarbamoyl adenosine modification protein (Sua5/YciO/YrdC/YwlC family)